MEGVEGWRGGGVEGWRRWRVVLGSLMYLNLCPFPLPPRPQCDAAGRTSEEEQLVLVNPSKSVSQIGTDPLLILDDVMYVAASMAVFSSTASLSSSCSLTCFPPSSLSLSLSSSSPSQHHTDSAGPGVCGRAI